MSDKLPTEEEIKNAIAANIARLRRHMNLTQAELAERLNYSDKAVSKWERAEGAPDVYILKKLADIFGVTADSLMSDEKDIKPASAKKTSARVRALVPVMSALAVLFAITLAYSVLTMLPENPMKRTWLLFVYALPGMAAVLIVFSAIWGKSLYTVLFVSAFIWSLALSLFLTLNVGRENYVLKNTYLFFIIAAPLQALTLLGYWLFRRTGVKSNPKYDKP